MFYVFIILLTRYVFFISLSFIKAWLTEALDTPKAYPASVKLGYSSLTFVSVFSTMMDTLLAAVAFLVESAFLSLT